MSGSKSVVVYGALPIYPVMLWQVTTIALFLTHDPLLTRGVIWYPYIITLKQR